MKPVFLTLTALALAAGASVAAPKNKPADAKSPICAVMQHEIGVVDADTPKSVYKGKTYYFCCAACKPTFDKNPEKYVKKKT